MNKNAKELIEKLAMGPVRGSQTSRTPRPALEKLFGRSGAETARKGAIGAGGLLVGGAGGYALGKHKKKKDEEKDEEKEDAEKKSSMKNIIDDLIKGAQHNTFGRPVVIQTDIEKSASEPEKRRDVTPAQRKALEAHYAFQKKGSEWTPLDTAKTAGALQFLGEQGYSVKQAAEYLGLTEDRVQFILKAVG